MRKLLVFSLVAAICCLTASSALAANLKIGVVDIEYVILKSKKGKAAKKKLKRIFDKKQKQLNTDQEKLLKLKEQIENTSDVTTAEKRKKLIVEYQQGVLKLQEAFVKHQQELAKKEVQLMKPIIKRLEQVLTEYAKAGGYDLILVRSQHGVVFAKPSFDITEDILTKVNT